MVKKASKSKRNGHVRISSKGGAVHTSTSAGGARASSGAARTCSVSGRCGGCTQVETAYADQLAAKDAAVVALFSVPRFEGADVRPIIGMDDPFHYRNKVASPFAPGKRAHGDGGRARPARGGKGAHRDAGRGKAAGNGSGAVDILTGMYAAGSHRIVPVDGCLLENEYGKQVFGAVKAIMGKHGIAPYDEDRGTGFMRHAIVRVGHESGEVLVTLVTNDDAFPNSKSFCRELVKRCPFITSIVQNVNTRQTNVILGEREQRLYGPGFILDTLCGLSFRISSQSFYQVNAVQTTVLYETAMQLAGLGAAPAGAGGAAVGGAGDVGALRGRACGAVVDAYCGTGTIGLVAASRDAVEVVGVDSVESAVRDARENARHNGIANARFVAADAGAFMREAAADGEHVDVVFMDPPRAGSDEAFLEALAQLAPACVVYISCNPKTQARDVGYLVGRGYRLDVVQPVDMFPHTGHIETVARLTRAQGH